MCEAVILFTDDHSLDEISFKNLVEFYREELLHVLNGVKVTKIFNTNERNKLRNAKILSYKNRMWFLSDIVKELLNTK